MHKHLEKMGEVNFDKIFNQKLGKFTNILNIYVSPAVECVLFWIRMNYEDACTLNLGSTYNVSLFLFSFPSNSSIMAM